MAQLQSTLHPARERFEQIAPEAKWLFEATEQARAFDGPRWPVDVYLPMPALLEILPEAVAKAGGPGALKQLLALGPKGMAQAMDPMLTMATWRMTQGIYRVDPTLYPRIIDKPINGDLSAEVLQRLPEWCIFVETPGLKARSPRGGEVDVLGAWARQDIEMGTRRRTLAIALLVPGDTQMPHQYLPLEGSLERSIDSVIQSWRDTSADLPAEAIEVAMSYMRPIINLLLYIASAGDFSRRGKSAHPSNPEPKRTRRDGWKLFPASWPTEWDVGVRTAAMLHAAEELRPTRG